MITLLLMGLKGICRGVLRSWRRIVIDELVKKLSMSLSTSMRGAVFVHIQQRLITVRSLWS